jgi:hypothetical protein
METSSSIWEILDEGKVLSPISLKNSYHIKNSMLIEISEDTDDGTFPRVSDYKRFANSLDDQGTSYFVNRLTRKKNKLKVDFWGATITRDADYETKAIIEFKDPIKVVMGYVGEKPIIEEVKKIEGEFTHDWFWRKSGRQQDIANGFEIWFNIEKYLE